MIGNIIILAILLVFFLFAVRSGVRHFKGEGGCCGGGSDAKPLEKKLDGPKIAEKTLAIAGMRCGHCSNRVASALNAIEGVAAKVSHSKGTAVVSLDREVADDVLRSAVEEAGYEVTDIR